MDGEAVIISCSVADFPSHCPLAGVWRPIDIGEGTIMGLHDGVKPPVAGILCKSVTMETADSDIGN